MSWRVATVTASIAASVMLIACGGGDKSSTSSGAPASSVAACSSDATRLPDGLCYVDTKVGSGPEVARGDVLEMDYVGKLSDGTVFDASSRHGGPFKFKLGAGEVIQGWDEGIVGMKVGGERTLTIPPALGYGAAGQPPVIPPNATLIFDVKVVSMQKGSA